MADTLISSKKSEHTMNLFSLCRICGELLTTYNVANYSSRLQFFLKMPFNEDGAMYHPSFCSTCYANMINAEKRSTATAGKRPHSARCEICSLIGNHSKPGRPKKIKNKQADFHNFNA